MDDVNCDSCNGFLDSLRAKVAGGKVFILIYYIVILVAAVLFLSSAYSIIAPVAEGETVTSVETTFLDEINYPVIFGCLSPQLAVILRNNPSTIGIGPLGDTATVSGCSRDQGVLVNGRFEQLASAGASCLPVITAASASAADSRILSGLNTAFGSDVCFLMNTDGAFKSTSAMPRELLLTIKQDRPLLDEALYGIIGVYAQGVSPFNSNGNLTASYYRLGAQNTLSTIGLEVDTIIDKRRSSFITIPSNPVFNTESEETSNIYILSTTTTTKYYQALNSTTAAPLVSTGGGGPESDYLFYVNGFTSRIITLRKRSFSEVWAMLGGALTGALVIITWVFREEVVKKPDGDDTEKVQVFRFQSSSRATQSAVDLVNKEAAAEATKTTDAEARNGTAGEIPLTKVHG